MSPHHVLMMLAAILAVVVADYVDGSYNVQQTKEQLTETDPAKCWNQMRWYAKYRGGEFETEKNGTAIVCKNREFTPSYHEDGQYFDYHNQVIKCYEDADKNYHLALFRSWSDIKIKKLEKKDQIFCANYGLTLCEFEATKMFDDDDVRVDDMHLNFTCNSDDAIPFIHINDYLGFKISENFQCGYNIDGPPKIYTWIEGGNKVELTKETRIFCMAPVKNRKTEQQPQQPSSDPAPPSQQPSSGPVSHQEQPGSNPSLQQLQQCSCHCALPRAQYPGYPAHQPQYQAYGPAPPHGYGPLEQCLCYCQPPVDPNAPVQDV